MIWTSSITADDPFVGELCADVARIEPAAADAAQEVARGVAAFCRERYDRQWLPADYVAHLIAVACRDVAGRGGGECRARSLETWRGLAARVYRPGEWAGGEPVWILDLGRVEGLPEERVELVWFPVVRRLLAGMAELWDASGGRGVLGLRGVAPAGLGGTALQAWRSELGRFSEAVLLRLKRRRGWTAVPRAMWLESVPAGS